MLLRLTAALVVALSLSSCSPWVYERHTYYEYEPVSYQRCDFRYHYCVPAGNRWR